MPKSKKRTRSPPSQLENKDDASLIDWGQIAAGPLGEPQQRWSDLSTEQINSCVGWATHLADDKFSLNISPLAVPENLPPRPSLLVYIHSEYARKLLCQNDKNDHDRAASKAWERFDTSALVALGIVWEELVTASLLPLATAHVRKCRRLEQESSRTAFQQWTLPPEEAAFELSRPVPRGQCPLLPTSRPCARTRGGEEDTDHLTQARNWCACHGTTLTQIQKAWSLFKLFVPREYERLGRTTTAIETESPAASVNNNKSSLEDDEFPSSNDGNTSGSDDSN